MRRIEEIIENTKRRGCIMEREINKNEMMHSIMVGWLIF
jgi:hypothetical protein